METVFLVFFSFCGKSVRLTVCSPNFFTLAAIEDQVRDCEDSIEEQGTQRT